MFSKHEIIKSPSAPIKSNIKLNLNPFQNMTARFLCQKIMPVRNYVCMEPDPWPKGYCSCIVSCKLFHNDPLLYNGHHLILEEISPNSFYSFYSEPEWWSYPLATKSMKMQLKFHWTMWSCGFFGKTCYQIIIFY